MASLTETIAFMSRPLVGLDAFRLPYHRLPLLQLLTDDLAHFFPVGQALQLGDDALEHPAELGLHLAGQARQHPGEFARAPLVRSFDQVAPGRRDLDALV